MPRITKHNLPRLLLTALTALLASCSASIPPLPLPSVKPPRIPVLPSQARQPPTPSECLPSCSAGLERELRSLSDLLTAPTSLVPPASNTPTDYSLPFGKLPLR